MKLATIYDGKLTYEIALIDGQLIWSDDLGRKETLFEGRTFTDETLAQEAISAAYGDSYDVDLES